MSERWKPEINEQFWYLDACVQPTPTTNNDWRIDKTRIARGNCFRTEAEAQVAAEKVKALLRSLHEPTTNSSQSVTDCNQLPKLTVEVFDRPDCPEWAKYAAVDADGNGFYYEDKPRACEADEEWLVDMCIVGTNRNITGNFDPTGWQNSLIERPVKETKLPDWCKVGEYVFHDVDEKYYKVESVQDYTIETTTVVGRSTRLQDQETFCNNYVQARLRPYNADEMRRLVGEVVSYTDKSRYFLISCADFCTDTPHIYFGETWHTAEEINKPSLYQLDNKPCGKLEHLENGEWVE